MYPFGVTKPFKKLGRLASIAVIVSAIPTMPLHAAVEAREISEGSAMQLRDKASTYKHRRTSADEYEEAQGQARLKEDFSMEVDTLCLAKNQATNAAEMDELTPLNVLFPDSMLANIIAEALDIDDVQTAVRKPMLGCIIKFDDYDYERTVDEPTIQTLEGMQYLTNMTDLYLHSHDFNDARPLGGLVNLKKLYLGGTNVTNLSPLGTLTGLKSLSVMYEGLSDVGPLQTLINLNYLDLSLNELRDIGPLAPLTKLTYLNLKGNDISHLSPLSTLRELTTLDVSNNDIANLTPLQPLSELNSIKLRENKISDISPLGAMTNISTLELGGFAEESQITDFTVLTQLPRLDNLLLERQDMTLVPDSVLSRLIILSIHFSHLTDITPFTKLSNLYVLNLTGNNISDLTPVRSAQWPRLLMLNLASNEIKDLTPFADIVFPALNYISLDYQTPLQQLEYADKIMFENDVKDVDGSIISPTTIVPEINGRYDVPYVIWEGLSGEPAVYYNWSKEVKINNVLTTFSGFYQIFI
jgi:internalin A